MTKFENPSFNSPAANKSYRDNYDKVFGKSKSCAKEGCEETLAFGYELCERCLEKAGITPIKPETD